MKNKILLFLTVFGLFAHQIKAQLVVNNSNTVSYYVQNVLLGSGVTVSNITFNGVAGSVSNPQLGEFNGTGTSPFLGINNGIVMATGDVSVAVGPNNTGSASAGGGNLGFGDADLDQLEGSGVGTNDAAILEFDFIPTGDTVEFKFVFGSEEYPEYVNSINDAFGFFLSGPGIAGPYTNGAINIALVPGTSTPVTINTVNSGSNPSYYVDNTMNTGGQSIQFDGYTTVMTAIAPVQCGVQFHIKIAIADASDAIYDSGVFLEGGSFSSNNTIDATTAVVPNDVYICNAPFNVSFSSGPTPPPNSYWDFGDGIGTSTQQNPTYTYADSGTYTVMFIASDPSPCVLPDTAWFNVTIIQTGAMTATFDIPPYNPCDDSLTINLEYTGTGEDSLYWDLGDGTTSNDTLVNHTYTANGDYVVTFMAWEYACGGFTTIYDTVHFNPVYATVTAIAPPPIFLCTQPYEVNFTGNSPAPTDGSYWDFGDTTIVSDTSWVLNPSYTYADTGVYNVMYVVIDSNTCNIVDTANFTVTVNLSDSLSADFTIPPLDPCTSNLTVQFINTGSGGDSLYWNMGNGVTFNDIDTVNYTYTVPGTYYVTFQAFDFVCNNTITIVDTVDYNPVYTTVTAVAPPPIVLCTSPYEVSFTGNSPAPPQCFWDFGDNTVTTDTSTSLNPLYTYADTGTYIVWYYVIDSSSCNIMDSAYFTVTVNLSDSLSADFVIPTLDACTDSLAVQFINTGNGDEIHWDMGNGTTFNNIDTVNYTYTVPGTYYVTFQAIDLVCNDTINIVDTVDYNPTYTTINATSPGNILLCAQPYDVNFTGNTPQPPNSYWNFGDGIGIDTAANPLYTYADTGIYNVQYVVIDSTTCNIADTVFFTVTIEVKQFNVSFNIPPYDPCSSDSLIVQFDIPGAIADSLYWNMGDGTTYIDSVTFDHTYTPGTYIINLEAYDFLCPSSNATFTDTVFYNPVYTAINAQPIDSVFSCGSLEVDFTGNTPAPPNSYWEFGDLVGGTSTQTNPTYTYASPGFYTVTYYAIDSTTCNVYDSLTFTVELVQAPSVNPSIYFEPPKPCEMDSFVVDLQFTGSGVDSIEWIMGDGAIFTTESVHYLYSAAGTYNIVLKVYNELCPHDPVSLGEIQFLDVSETSGIIPNIFTPNGDDWNDELVFVGVDNTQDYSIRIFDRWGRTAYESTDPDKNWDGKNAAEGTYFYELRYTDICSFEEKIVTGTVTLLRGPKK